MNSISEVYNIDCMEYMKTIPDKFFELAIVDPPYGINITGECMGGRKTISIDKSKTWDCKTPDSSYFKELMRISKNQIIWGGNYFELPTSRYFMIWDKGETMYGRDFAECEYVWVYAGGTRIFKTSPNQLKRIHATQKPIKLYSFILKNYAKQGDKIFDSHLGSGSSRIAAYKMGFDFYACEIDKDYFDAQEERFRLECLGERKLKDGRILIQTNLFT
jgi:site-specific DNA-methyltransferase (adenine-specific)